MPSLPPVFGCLQYAKTEERFGNNATCRSEGHSRTSYDAQKLNVCLFYRIWDIECGACLKLLEGHDDLVRYV